MSLTAAGPAGEPYRDDVHEAVVNGLMLRTGEYASSPMPVSVLAAIASGAPVPEHELTALRARQLAGEAHAGLPQGVAYDDLSQAGWGVVFAQDDPLAMERRKALEPLLERRQGNAGERYREFIGDAGLRAGESGFEFLARHGLGPGPIDPRRVPYYLLLVGSATDITFDVQTDLDSRHGVGRLHFDGDESLADLERYGRSIVDRECRAPAPSRRCAVWAPRNPGDVSTARSAALLAEPLADHLRQVAPQWTVDAAIGPTADKQRLLSWLRERPTVLFAASHGLRLAPGDAEQASLQGALVSQEWPGPLGAPRALESSMYIAAGDLPDGVEIGGALVFLFGCFTAGTPLRDEFGTGVPPAPLAPAPIIARLPQRLLAAGAAAVIGHVERAWTCSFMWPGVGAQIEVFLSTMRALTGGEPVGAATRFLEMRYGDVSVELAGEVRNHNHGKKNAARVAHLFTAQADARNYCILGDPAVRLS